jgi:hypothetical protein
MLLGEINRLSFFPPQCGQTIACFSWVIPTKNSLIAVQFWH